jgi:glucokinase
VSAPHPCRRFSTCGEPVLALDIGGTKLAAGVIATNGDLLAELACPTEALALPTEVLAPLFALAEQVLSQAGLSYPDLCGLGVSFGGPVDFPSGMTVTCHHLPGWEGISLRDLVAEHTGLPVVLDNDANAAALGETVFGAAKGCEQVLYVTVSTGIGAGLVLSGRIHRGANSMAGELGHTLVAPDGPECACGRRGCLEAVAAGPAIARAAREALAGDEPSSLRSLALDRLTAKDVAEAAPTDPLAARILQHTGEYLGLALAAAINLVNPEIVVIGGGVSQAGDCLFIPLRDALLLHTVPESTRELRVVPAALGAQSALFGAAALGMGEVS